MDKMAADTTVYEIKIAVLCISNKGQFLLRKNRDGTLWVPPIGNPSVYIGLQSAAEEIIRKETGMEITGRIALVSAASGYEDGIPTLVLTYKTPIGFNKPKQEGWEFFGLNELPAVYPLCREAVDKTITQFLGR